MYVLFINLTSVNYDQNCPISELNTEKYFIDIGLLNNMLFWLSNSSDEHLIVKIYKCLNNVLTFKYPHLPTVVINHFLPTFDLFLESATSYKAEFIEEYLILLKNLIKYQKLTETDITSILEERNVIK